MWVKRVATVAVPIHICETEALLGSCLGQYQSESEVECDGQGEMCRERWCEHRLLLEMSTPDRVTSDRQNHIKHTQTSPYSAGALVRVE